MKLNRLIITQLTKGYSYSLENKKMNIRISKASAKSIFNNYKLSPELRTLRQITIFKIL